MTEQENLIRRLATSLERSYELSLKLDPDPTHSKQVARLALIIFNQLSDVHNLGRLPLLLLHHSALLHDIGLSEGKKAHHKRSRDLILKRAKWLPMEMRKLTALIARYHRKALPKESHRIFGDLSDEKKHLVWVNGAILRIADALDRSHCSLVQGITIERKSGMFIFVVENPGDIMIERYGFKEKMGMFERAIGMCDIRQR